MFTRIIALPIVVVLSILFFGTTDGFAQVTWTDYTFENTNQDLGSNLVYAVAVEPNTEGKIVWFGTRPDDNQGWPGGLSKFNTETERWTHLTTDNSGLPHNRVWDIEFDTDGNMWIGTHGGGLVKFDGDNWTVYDNTSTGGNVWNNVYQIEIDSQGYLWCSGGPETNDVGLTVTDRNGNWAVYSPSNSNLSQTAVYAIAFDKVGNKWIGTRDNGIDKLDDNGTPLVVGDGDFWTHYSTSDGLTSNNINVGTAAIDSTGGAWVGYGTAGTEDGCSRFDGTSWTSYLIGDARIRSIVVDSDGIVWLGDKGGVEVSTGLWKFDGMAMENVFVDDVPDDNKNYINMILLDEINGIVWLGTHGAGALKVEGLIEPKLPGSVNPDKLSVVSDFNLAQNYPNPFNPETFIEYSLYKPQNVRLAIYNVEGQLIRTLVNAQKQPGKYTVMWDGRNQSGNVVSSGLYIYRIETEIGGQVMKKAIFIK